MEDKKYATVNLSGDIPITYQIHQDYRMRISFSRFSLKIVRMILVVLGMLGSVTQ